MKFYVISIDEGRYTDFLSRNPGIGNFQRVGVDGRALSAVEYFRLAVAGRRVPMTPSELGCSLSHINALQDFLSSDEEFVCIVEDDITFKESQLSDIKSTLKKLDTKPVVLHLGGQNGLPGRWKIYGRAVNDASAPIWLVAPSSLRWLWRTCGYVANRSMAESIVATQLKRVALADSWRSHAKVAGGVVLYYDAIDHPIDLASSSIEKERKELVEGSRLRKYSQKILGLFIFLGLRISGMKRIHGG